MSADVPSLSFEDMMDNQSIGRVIGNLQRNNIAGGLRSSASESGTAGYGITAPSLSDIMQGTFNYRDPNTVLNMVNSGLTEQLQNINSMGGGQSSVFTSQNIIMDAMNVSNSPSHSGEVGGDATSQSSAPITGNAAYFNPENIKKAAQKLLDHPNFLMARDGQPGASALRGQLLNGTVITTEQAAFTGLPAGRNYVAPNLINVLWYLCENGFVLAKTAGLWVVRRVNNGSGSNKASNHSFGRAIDISAVGREGSSSTYNIIKSESYPIILDMYSVIAQMSESRMPDEIGGPFDYDYKMRVKLDHNVKGGRFYTDNLHKDHLHIGFKSGGELFPAFVDGNSNSSGTSITDLEG